MVKTQSALPSTRLKVRPLGPHKASLPGAAKRAGRPVTPLDHRGCVLPPRLAPGGGTGTRPTWAPAPVPWLFPETPRLEQRPGRQGHTGSSAAAVPCARQEGTCCPGCWERPEPCTASGPSPAGGGVGEPKYWPTPLQTQDQRATRGEGATPTPGEGSTHLPPWAKELVLRCQGWWGPLGKWQNWGSGPSRPGLALPCRALTSTCRHKQAGKTTKYPLLLGPRSPSLGSAPPLRGGETLPTSPASQTCCLPLSRRAQREPPGH